MSPEIEITRAAFMYLFQARMKELAALPRQRLNDLQHEANELRQQVQLPFSERAAAEITHAAATLLLE